MEADEARFPVLLTNGNPIATRQGGRRPPLGRMGRSVPQAVLSVRARRRRPDAEPRHASRPCPAARSISPSGCARRTCRRPQHAMDSLKAAMAWDERVYGREYDLDLFNIVAVSDFNMGAMENKGLNIFNSRYVLADTETATDADFDEIAARRRARIFPQLVGRPGHLPRLVPAQPQGRLHRLPRPELLGRHGQPGGQADRGRAHRCARSSFPRIPGRWRTRSGPTAISRFRTSTRRPSTTRAPS